MQSEKERVQYYVENRQLQSRVNGLKVVKNTFDHKLSDLWHDCDGLLAKGKIVSDAL